MKTSASNYDTLAALGGKPVFEKSPSMAWPPTDPGTEAELVNLYRSQQWSWNGQWEQKLCSDLARIHTARHAIYMVNGTVTLEAALHALGVKPGDEVIVPALTWLATAMAVLYVGATPVFVDVEADTMCLDPNRVREAITPATRAIIPVHLYGSMADMDEIMEIARKHDLAVIEDCAHAQGGRWNGRGVGSIGDAGSISFQQSKALSAGEGGVVITNDDRLAELLYRFKHIGYNPGSKQGKGNSKAPADFDCRNYRGTEFSALVLNSQVRGLEAMIERRGKAADFLTRGLEEVPGLKVQARGRRADPGCQGYYAFMMTIDPGLWPDADIATIQSAATAENLPVMSTYGPVYEHPLWNVSPERYRICGEKGEDGRFACPVAEKLLPSRAVGFLHMFLDLPEADLQKVIDVFHKLYRNAGKLGTRNG